MGYWKSAQRGFYGILVSRRLANSKSRLFYGNKLFYMDRVSGINIHKGQQSREMVFRRKNIMQSKCMKQKIYAVFLLL